MALFDFLRLRKRDGSDAAAPKADNITTVPWASAGENEVTTTEMALRVATVYRCADILSKGVAQLPLIIKRDRGGYFTEDTNDIFGLYHLLRWMPNERQSAFELMRSAMLQLIFRGNAILVPEIGAKEYRRIVLLTPGAASYDKYTNLYTINDVVNGVFGIYPAKEVIHIKNISTDGGYWGVSTIAYAGRVLAITSNADRENVDTFKSGGLVRGFVSGKGGGTIGFGAIQDSQLASVAENVEKQLASGKNIFNLPGEMSFNQLSLSPKDLELLATKQFNVLEICRFFGVHPDKVFAQQSTNYKASEMSQVSFLTDTLQPYLTQIETEFQIKLIPRALAGEYRIDFDIEPLMQTDLTTQATYMEKTIAAGARSVNDWRRKLGQKPVPGGDEPLVSANLVPLNSPKLRGEATQNKE